MKKMIILLICIFSMSITFACDWERPGQDNDTCDSQSPVSVDSSNIGEPPTGPYDVVIEQDAELMTHTIYRPSTGTTKMPIIVWGNGGCMQDGTGFEEFLTELASHGFLIIADGAPRTAGAGCGGMSMSDQSGTALTEGLDWAFAANKNRCSSYYQKLDTTKVAAMGQSCGGLMTLGISADPRLTTLIIWNSGLFQRDAELYANLHTPMAYFIGGESDIAYENAEADFAAINNVPLFYGNLDVGHMATYYDDNGGEFARVGTAWLKWQLLGDTGPDGAEMFSGSNCGLCNSDWVIQKKNME